MFDGIFVEQHRHGDMIEGVVPETAPGAAFLKFLFEFEVEILLVPVVEVGAEHAERPHAAELGALFDQSDAGSGTGGGDRRAESGGTAADDQHIGLVPDRYGIVFSCDVH